jgi:ribokinase
MTSVAVVGHVEWVDFVPVDHFPEPGELLHAPSSFARAAGGGGVAAVVAAELGAEVEFFCALGRDAHGEATRDQLQERGVKVHVAWRSAPTRRAITLLEAGGERTIVTIGERLLPMAADELPWARLRDIQGVYFTAGDREVLVRARAAGALVATPRAGEALLGKGPELDALVFSAQDRDESDQARAMAARARLLVATEGGQGGRWCGAASGRWDAMPPPRPPRDTYGCGDSFAAGFTFGLAEGRPVADAARIGAQCGARCLSRVGAP